MDKTSGNCCICLQIDSNLRKINESDANNLTLLCKLRFCVAEIDWKENYMMCYPCIADLNVVYEFLRKCLRSESIRNQQIQTISDQEIENEPQDDKPAKTNKACRFVCETCQLSYRTSTQLKSHSSKVHQIETVKPFNCDICNRKFGCSANLSQHLKYHKDNRTHICTFCGKSFNTRGDLKIHEKTHLNKREYKCDECPKSFNTHKDLRSHKLVVHTDPSFWQHVCDICKKRFPIKSNYDAHVRRHKNERPFACHLCDKRFIDKCVLQKHFRTHSNIRAYMCEICKKEYKDKRVMDIHKAKIHGIGDIKVPVKKKKYFCHVCPKAYFEKNKLTRHLYTHTGEKPYFCKICQKKFICNSYVKQHLKKVHNVDESEEN